MKKRILSLALVLMMIISLLPVTAFAAKTQSTVVIPKVGYVGSKAGSAFINDVTDLYYGFQDVYDAEDPTILLGQKVVTLSAAPENGKNYVHFHWDESNNVLQITLNEISYKKTDTETNFITVYANSTETTQYSNAFDIELTIVGKNEIDGGTMNFSNTGKMTITGTPGASLTHISRLTGDATFQRLTACGETKIQDVTMTLINTYAPSSGSGTATITCNGPLTIENSDITLYTGKGRGIVLASDYNKTPGEYALTIKDSNILIEGGLLQEDGTVDYRSGLPQMNTKGETIFNNSNVELHRADTGGTSNNYSVIRMVPEFIGNYTSIQVRGGTNNTPNKSYKDLTEETGTDIMDKGYRHFIAICEASEPEEPECEHVPEEGEYTCDQAIPCAKCDQNYREAGGECTPETDDKDCTTALKCSVCKKEITPAADNHAYAEQWNAEGKKPCENANCEAALVCEHTYDCGFCTECGVEDMGTGYVATAAGKKYKSLAAALYYANGAEVKLLKNVNYSALTITKDTKINLDGKMLYINNSAAASAITVNAGKTLEIVGGDLRVSRGNAFTALIENNGNLIVTDVVIRGTELGGENAIVLLNKGTATVKGASAVVAASNANYSIVNKGTCEINIAEANGVKARIQGVLAQEEGELTLTSIRLLGKLTYAAGKVTKAEVVSVTAPSGYIWNQNVLEVKNPIVEVNGVKYASLEDAIAKANGEQINLLRNVYVGALEITKDAKINIGAYKLYIKQTAGKTAGITINTGVTLTLMGGDLRVTGENDYEALILIENNGKLVVDSVVIRGTEMGNANAAVLINKGEAEINGASALVAVARENCAIVNTGSCVINIAKTDAINARIYGAIDNDGELDEKVAYQHFGNKI